MKATTATAPYTSLPMTEEFLLFPQDNPDSIPISLVRDDLRSYSPFIISLNPPPNNRYIRSQTRALIQPFSSPLRASDTRLTGYPKTTPSNLQAALPTRAPAPVRPYNEDTSGVSVFKNDGPGFTGEEQLLDVAKQIAYLQDIPPLVLMINPSSFNQEFNQIQAYQEQSRYGFIFHRWGEDLPKISINCRIGSFICGRASQDSEGLSGLQFASRKDSAAWRNLMNLMSIYKNSAAVHDRIGRSRAFHDIGTQSIHYDGQEWVGRITEFTYGFDESTQHGGSEFSMNFTVYQHFYKDFDFKSSILPLYNAR